MPGRNREEYKVKEQTRAPLPDLSDPPTTDPHDEITELKATMVESANDDEMNELNTIVGSAIDANREENRIIDDGPLVIARAIQKRMREEKEVQPTPAMAGFTFRPKKKAREELMTLEEMRRLRG